jgi:hypothetical protein
VGRVEATRKLNGIVAGEKSPSLTMSARVKQYLGTLLRALIEERHFALVDGLRISNLGSPIHNSICSSASSRSNQRACPLAHKSNLLEARVINHNL